MEQSLVDIIRGASYRQMIGMKYRIALDNNYYVLDDAITFDWKGDHVAKVIKVHKMNWWKRILSSLRIKRTWFIGVTVIQIS